LLKKLKIKFVVFAMSIVVIMLGVIFGTVYHFTALGMETEARQLMQRLLDEPMHPERPMRPEREPKELHLPYFVLELDSAGELVSTSGGYYDLSDRDFVEDVLRLVSDIDADEGRLEKYDLRFIQGTSPVGTKIVFVDSSNGDAALRGLVRTGIFIGLGSLLVFFGLSLLLAQVSVKPVEQAWKQQRQFVADASHELKTPLTVIMTSAELIQSEGCNKAEHSKLSHSILTMSRQMRGLVEVLLDLARADNGSGNADFETLEFSELASDALLPFEPMFFEAGLELESHISPALRVRGSRRQLCQVMDILLDNALKYSSPGGRVCVALQRQGCHCLLSVKGPGQELSRQELKDIFKRFYRTDKVRSSGGGYGLGLSIAQGIVSVHKGRIWAESGNGENRFFVSLPLE